MADHPASATELLVAWGRGEASALDRLIPLVHDELRRIGRRYMQRERPGHTLQATALVNEAYLRLIEVQRVQWQNRAHFLAVAATLMRRVLVDAARARGGHKRGGGFKQVSLAEALVVAPALDIDVLALDEALRALGEVDARKSRVVELRFFGGLNVDETAEVLGVSPDTVKRDWRFAKLWLLRALHGDAPGER